MLIDSYIENNQLGEFIDDLMNRHKEDLLWEVWIHKVFDKDYEEYKNSLDVSNQAQVEYMTKDEVKTTVNKSKEILSNFKPQ